MPHGASEHTDRTPPARLAVAVIGFGCLFAYSRMLALGFKGFLDLGPIASADEFYLVRSIARMLAIVLIMVLQLRPNFSLGRRAVIAAAGAMAATTVLFAMGCEGVLGAVVAIAAGAANGLLLYAWCLVLCNRPPRQVVGTTIAALLVAGGVLMVAPIMHTLPCLVLLSVAAFASGPSILALDPALDACKAKRIARSEAVTALRSFPWFSAVMVIACGVLGTIFYGIATSLFWRFGDPANFAVLGVAVTANIAATSLIILKARNGMNLVWVPTFALLLVGLLFSCLTGAEAREAAIALMLSSVFCYHFMRWLIFPCMIGSSRAPRALLCGGLLLVTNNFLTSHIGEILAEALPQNLQNIGSVAFLLCVVLIVLFAAAVLFASRAAERTADRNDPERGRTIENTIESTIDETAERCGLTGREREIALLTARGYSSTYIANELVIASSTVRYHQQNAYRKLGVHSREELMDLLGGRTFQED